MLEVFLQEEAYNAVMGRGSIRSITSRQSLLIQHPVLKHVVPNNTRVSANPIARHTVRGSTMDSVTQCDYLHADKSETFALYGFCFAFHRDEHLALLLENLSFFILFLDSLHNIYAFDSTFLNSLQGVLPRSVRNLKDGDTFQIVSARFNMETPSSGSTDMVDDFVTKLVFFSNDFPSDDRKNLFRLLQRLSKDKRFTMLATLLENCTRVLQKENALLPQRLRDLIPPFDDILTLVDSGQFRFGPLGAAMESAFLVILQLGMLIG
jgi:hypothetical protein